MAMASTLSMDIFTHMPDNGNVKITRQGIGPEHCCVLFFICFLVFHCQYQLLMSRGACE